MAVPAGQARIWTLGDPRISLRCLLGSEPPKITSGYARWELIDRPGRRPLTVHSGLDNLQIELSLVLRDSPGDQMRALEKMAGRDAGDPVPPLVRFEANLPQHDAGKAPSVAWVISGLEWGAARYSNAAVLLSQEVAVTFMQHEDSSLHRLRVSPAFQLKTMKKGENLRAFAKRTLGDARRWRDVASLNRDDPRVPSSPDHEITRSHKVKLPPREPVTRRARR
jgi:hypothetical protein